MNNDTQESENTICTSSFRPNSVMFITHMKAGHMFGSRRHTVLEKSYGSDSKEQRAQVIATNKKSLMALLKSLIKHLPTILKSILMVAPFKAVIL